MCRLNRPRRLTVLMRTRRLGAVVRVEMEGGVGMAVDMTIQARHAEAGGFDHAVVGLMGWLRRISSIANGGKIWPPVSWLTCGGRPHRWSRASSSARWRCMTCHFAARSRAMMPAPSSSLTTGRQVRRGRCCADASSAHDARRHRLEPGCTAHLLALDRLQPATKDVPARRVPGSQRRGRTRTAPVSRAAGRMASPSMPSGGAGARSRGMSCWPCDGRHGRGRRTRPVKMRAPDGTGLSM
jgi:hypothetical protein